MMKAKLFIAFLIADLLFFSGTTKAQNPVADKGASLMLKEFYTTYMTEVAGSAPPKEFEKKLTLLKRKYCTTTFINKIPKLAEQTDSDPVIKAQDSSTECVRTLIINPDLKKPNQYIASYTDGYSKVMIHIAVVKQNGAYMIDNIW